MVTLGQGLGQLFLVHVLDDDVELAGLLLLQSRRPRWTQLWTI
jgi:hypothetical protein